MFRGWPGSERAAGTTIRLKTLVSPGILCPSGGIPSVASGGEESEKHRLELFGCLSRELLCGRIGDLKLPGAPEIDPFLTETL